jgi:hypothetical protein
MSIALEKFEEAKKKFSANEDVITGKKTIKKIEALINEIGSRFEAMNGGEISEFQTKIAGYKFYLADSIADVLLKSKFLKNYIESYKAQNWGRVRQEIEDEKGKVKNKQEIENVLIDEIKEYSNEQLFYDAEYIRLNAKAIAASEILTALVQRKAELSKQLEQAKNL